MATTTLPTAPAQGDARTRVEQPIARHALDRAFLRTTGAPLVHGNAVQILRDAGENYPAWLAAIRGARDKIYFESYIVANDRVGREFADALAERARAGVRVRVVHDWLGTERAGPLWSELADAGARRARVQPVRLDEPAGLAVARSSQDDRDRRPRRVRQRLVREREVAGRSRAQPRAVARHRRRVARPGGGGCRARVRERLEGVRRRFDSRRRADVGGRDRVGGVDGGARRRRRAEHRRPLPSRPAHRNACPAASLAHRCLFRRRRAVRAGAVRGRARRRRRAPSRPGQQRHSRC